MERFMQFIDRYPAIVTNAHTQCRDFWVSHLGFSVVFENEWFAYLRAQAGSASIAFMSPAHPSAPPGPEPFEAGMSMELEVADADAALAELRASGRNPDYPLTEEAFGQRRFSVREPSGLWINIVQQLG
jgi:catechol 2,3-dioxygenase-like lactoylglutathione lyase family enzyme